MMFEKLKLLHLFIFLLPFGVLAQSKISADVSVKQLVKGKKIEIEKTLCYDASGKMVIHFKSPEEYFFLTNTYGEAKIYNPKRNEVLLVNEKAYSSENEILYCFFSGRYDDLVLQKNGFKLKSTDFDQNYLIREYEPPTELANTILKVEIVYENHLPIFCAFYKPQGQIARKCYYSKYYISQQYVFPQRITYISFLNDKDSTIHVEEYKNVKFNVTPENEGVFNFEVPSNAKLVKNEKK